MDSRYLIAATLFFTVLMAFFAGLAAVIPGVPVWLAILGVLVAYPVGLFLDVLPPGRPGRNLADFEELVPGRESKQIRATVAGARARPPAPPAGYVPAPAAPRLALLSRNPDPWAAVAIASLMVLGVLAIALGGRLLGDGGGGGDVAVAGVLAPGAGGTAAATRAPAFAASSSAAPAETASAAGRSAGLTGTWEVRDTITGGRDKGQTFSFRVTLSDDGKTITGQGADLAFRGKRDGDSVTLTFTRAGAAGGSFTWKLGVDGQLTGTFKDDSSKATGMSIARRVP